MTGNHVLPRSSRIGIDCFPSSNLIRQPSRQYCLLMYFMPAVLLKEVYNHSWNSDLFLVIFSKVRSTALLSIATLSTRINTDSSLGMGSSCV